MTTNKETTLTPEGSMPKEINLEEVLEYVNANIEEVVATLSKCVDGRYVEDLGAMSYPGADLGLAMALMGVTNPQTGQKFTAQEALGAVVSYLEGEGRLFCWHTDNHGEGAGHCGCGHANAAAQHSYSEVSGGNYTELWNLANALDKQQTHSIVLNGNHAEAAILKVKGTKHSVKASDGDKQFFIYNEDLYHAQIDGLAKAVKIDANELWGVAEQQLKETLTNLSSSQGKQIFEVNFDEGETPTAKVTFAGLAPKPESK